MSAADKCHRRRYRKSSSLDDVSAAALRLEALPFDALDGSYKGAVEPTSVQFKPMHGLIRPSAVRHPSCY